jgi:hypothetical protein
MKAAQEQANNVPHGLALSKEQQRTQRIIFFFRGYDMAEALPFLTTPAGAN